MFGWRPSEFNPARAFAIERNEPLEIPPKVVWNRPPTFQWEDTVLNPPTDNAGLSGQGQYQVLQIHISVA